MLSLLRKVSEEAEVLISIGKCRTDSSFGQTGEPNGDGLQWPQGAICSSDLPETNCDGAAKVDASDMKLEFGSVDTPTCLSLDISQVPIVKEQCLGTDVTSRSLPGPVQLQLPQQLLVTPPLW